MNDKDLRRNGSGYLDLTAYQAIKNIEHEKFKTLLNTIFDIADSSGFQIANRIVLVDKKTGKIWR